MRFILLVTLFIFSVPVLVKANDFVPYLNSVPLMHGFTVSAEEALIFDKPEGRFVEIDIWCEHHCPDNTTITDYYADVLSTLGWIHSKPLKFMKNNEWIQIDIFAVDEGIQKIIRFRSNS